MTHWKKLLNPDYIGSWDFEKNPEIIVTIKSVTKTKISSESGEDDRIVIHFEENVKPLLCKNENPQRITKLSGTSDYEKWIGEKIILHVEKVKAYGGVHDAVRVKKSRVQLTKPTLNESHPKWSEAIKAVQGGKDAATFRTHFEVSDEDVIKLNQYKPKQ
jgi:hypothetical protein